MSSRTVVRVGVAIMGLLVVLVAIRGWRVASRQYDAPGEGLARSDSTEATQEAINKGRALFHGSGTCAMCHGQQLEGGIGPTLRAHPWKDAKGGEMPAIYAVITHGVPNTAMVAHPGGISDAQATQLAAYVWAVSHDKAKP
jgi:mono/diheme cytochrome c family protein